MNYEELRALADAAYPGPWTVKPEIDGMRAGRRTVVQAGTGSLQRRIVTVDQTRLHHDETAEANIAFIAAARTAIPELLARHKTDLHLIGAAIDLDDARTYLDSAVSEGEPARLLHAGRAFQEANDRHHLAVQAYRQSEDQEQAPDA